MSIKNKKILKIGSLYFVFILIATLFIGPLIYLFVSSLKNDRQIVADMSSINAFIPYGELSLDNYFSLLDRMDFAKYFMNSATMTALTIFFGIFINSMMGYSIALLNFKGRKLLISLMLALAIIPVESIIINRFMVANSLGLLNTIFGLVIPNIAMPIYIYLFYTHFKGMPRELTEAGIVDGLSYIGIFWKIMLPLSKPICATVSIMIFIRAWGDLLWPTLVTRDDSLRTLPQVLKALYASEYTFWGEIFAFGVMATLPALVVFLLFQKQFVQSVASSGIKG